MLKGNEIDSHGQWYKINKVYILKDRLYDVTGVIRWSDVEIPYSVNQIVRNSHGFKGETFDNLRSISDKSYLLTVTWSTQAENILVIYAEDLGKVESKILIESYSEMKEYFKGYIIYTFEKFEGLYLKFMIMDSKDIFGKIEKGYYEKLNEYIEYLRSRYLTKEGIKEPRDSRNVNRLSNYYFNLEESYAHMCKKLNETNIEDLRKYWQSDIMEGKEIDCIKIEEKKVKEFPKYLESQR